MNKIFKVLWNSATQTFVVTSELGKSGKKNKLISNCISSNKKTIKNFKVKRLLLLISFSLTSLSSYASVVINDVAAKTNGNGKLSFAGSSGGSATTASQNSFAAVGDADWNEIDESYFDAKTLFGTDSKNTDGLFGFGVETSAKTYGKLSNAGTGQKGQKAWGDSSAGLIKLKTASNSRATQALGLNSNALGQGAQANGYTTNAIGQQATASGAAANAIGLMANASGQGANAIGIKATASNVNTIAFGALSTASSESAIAIGALTSAKGNNSIAIGGGDANTSGAIANNANDIALGSGSSTSAVSKTSNLTFNGKTYNIAGQSGVGAMSIGNRQLQQVAAGSLSETSTDGVNGSQLYAVQKASENEVNDINNRLALGVFSVS
ncbi:ESPR-type extended signal peptide-containing protein, partial [Providencia rettgeri]